MALGRAAPSRGGAYLLLGGHPDRSRDLLADLQRRHHEATRQLAIAKPTFSALQQRGLTDAQAASDAHTLAADIVRDEQALALLGRKIEVAQQAVRRHAALAAKYFQLVEDARARLEPLVAALDGLDGDLRWAITTSRELDQQASTLLAATGDRQFRRTAVDPRGALLLALQELVASLTRLNARHVKERVS